MIELVLLVCLKSEPGDCEERSRPYLAETSLLTCMVAAQPQLAIWSEAHPHLTIARWTCRIPRDETEA